MPSNYGVDQAAMIHRLSNDRLIQLTDDENTGAIVASRVTEAIEAAEAEFHLFAGVYYDAPVRTAAGAIPTGLREQLIELTAWRLQQRRSENLRSSEDEGKLWEGIRKRLDGWLDDISSADMKKRKPIPGAVERLQPDPPRAGSAEVVSDTQVFSLTSMGGFMGG
jgi:phage gp36-like protein